MWRRAKAAAAVGLVAATGLAGPAATRAAAAGRSAIPPSILWSGQELAPGQALGTPNGQFVLTMQPGGDLVETTGGLTLWASGTDVAGSVAVMQANGNLAVDGPTGTPLWSTHTGGHPGAILALLDSGALQVSQSGDVRWHTAVPSDELQPGQPLDASWSVTSSNGLFEVVVASDGSLSERLISAQSSTLLWIRYGRGAGGHAVLQRDGDFVLYGPTGKTAWASGTSGHPGAHLVVDDDAEVQVVSATGAVLWQSDSTSLRTDIVSIADSQLGYQDSPAGTFCNIYSAYWGSGGECGNGLRSEPWCADFASWVWRRAGVSFDYGWRPGDLSASAASFYSWAVRHGRWHWVGSGYRPRPGDVAVFGLDASRTYADHVAVVIGPGDPGVDAINGDSWWDGNGGVGVGYDEYTATGTDTISGYASP